jgi:hypothetical protein
MISIDNTFQHADKFVFADKMEFGERHCNLFIQSGLVFGASWIELEIEKTAPLRKHKR